MKESLETINDSRIDRCKKHSLVDILMIVFFGLLCGYKSIESIHLYAELSINVLKKYLLLANGIPNADTILRVLARIDTEQLGVCFGQIKTEEKSNEIAAIPELLDLLDLKGGIVTIDAMGCQKKIAGKITEKKSDYVFSLKGNQEKIHDDVKEFFTGHQLDEKYCERYKIQKYEGELEIGHGRIEKEMVFYVQILNGSKAKLHIINRCW